VKIVLHLAAGNATIMRERMIVPVYDFIPTLMAGFCGPSVISGPISINGIYVPESLSRFDNSSSHSWLRRITGQRKER
jgi:hypothetical protein